MQVSSEDIAKILKAGGVGVMATDTIYGLVGSAFEAKAVEKIYKLKGRQANKPFIILISRLDDLALFDIDLNQQLKNRLSAYWPGPVSIVLPCPHTKFAYLHRGGKTLAFRQPAKTSLRRLLAKTGPLVAPSANPEGLAPAVSLTQAKQYFGEQVDFYRRGRTSKSASRVIRFGKNGLETLRA